VQAQACSSCLPKVFDAFAPYTTNMIAKTATAIHIECLHNTCPTLPTPSLVTVPTLTHMHTHPSPVPAGATPRPPPPRRGYDVFAFAAAWASVSVGLDICPIAISAAQAEQQAELSGNPSASAAVSLCAGDFFSHSASGDFKGPYDIGYDYTFLCALHPGSAVCQCMCVWGGGAWDCSRFLVE